jgi:biopolymer transport protein ExbB
MNRTENAPATGWSLNGSLKKLLGVAGVDRRKPPDCIALGAALRRLRADTSHPSKRFLGQRAVKRFLLIVSIVWCLVCLAEQVGFAQNDNAPPAAAPDTADAAEESQHSVRELLNAGGEIGWIIIALSVAAVALIVEHVLSIRRGALIPIALAEQTHQLISQGKYSEAEQIARASSSFLGHVLTSGLMEVSIGYKAVEKAMEDSAAEQAARLFRKIEYLSVIGTIAPMLGLLGTVLGMIQAFDEFKTQANPQVSQLAPGISQALVTTAMGLIVAVPALTGYSIFRNRIDGLVAEAALMAEHLFSDFKRRAVSQRKTAAAQQQPTKKPAG